MGLILVGGVVGAARVDAASLTLDWTAPTTNADGTRLTDLGSYRIYLGTSSPACPSASFFTVTSPTSSPANGQTMSIVVASLSAGTTYFARVTAVDGSGNESACSASASGVAKADFSVTPSTTTSFGSVPVNTSVDRTFTVQNMSRTSLAGTASIAAPYSISSGGSFSLAPGASQIVTVRFRPISSGTFASNVNFVAGGDTISRAVTGSGTGSTPTTVTLSTSSQPGGPYTGVAGQLIQFDGRRSSGADGGVQTYRWYFGDGATATGSTPTHRYAKAGTYRVFLNVTDYRGAMASANTTATISGGQLPTSKPGGPYSGRTGQLIQFDGTRSVDSDGSIQTYQWYFGDGATATGARPTHKYAKAGTYRVYLTVTDNSGNKASGNTTSTIVP